LRLLAIVSHKVVQMLCRCVARVIIIDDQHLAAGTNWKKHANQKNYSADMRQSIRSFTIL